MLFAAWLSDAIIYIQGPDAEKYLQGQFTADICALKNNTAQITAHCNAQGRIVSLGYCLKKSTQEYFYIIPKDTAELAIKNLKKFLIRAKVQINFFTPTLTLPRDGLGDQQKAIMGLMGEIPEDSQEDLFKHLFKIDATRALWIDVSCRGESCIRPDENKIKQVDEAAWLKNQIENKTVFLNTNTQEAFLPDEIKLASQQGVCLTKGCFIGQEIIARMHYKSQSKNILNTFISEDLSLKALDIIPAGKIICQIIFDQKNYCLILSKTSQEIHP